MPQQSKLELSKNKLTDSTNGNDPYRDSFIRFFGFSHIVGQTTQYIICRPMFTNLCTGVSILYCVFDVYDKYSKAKKYIPKPTCGKTIEEQNNSYQPYIAAGNAVLWQNLASFLVPGYAVNRITYATRRILNSSSSCMIKHYLPPIIGIASIPFIVWPIDSGVNKLLKFENVKKETFVKDTYRDTYVRLLGYTFVISRTAYRSLHKRRDLIDICYGISVLYAFADAIDKCNRAYERGEGSNTDKNIQIRKPEKILGIDYKYETIITAVDVLFWQSLASFFLPGLILRSVRLFIRKTVRGAPIKRNVRTMLPAIIALATVPFIIIPIDQLVDELLEHTYRKLFYSRNIK